jgi:hypothetical protein
MDQWRGGNCEPEAARALIQQPRNLPKFREIEKGVSETSGGKLDVSGADRIGRVPGIDEHVRKIGTEKEAVAALKNLERVADQAQAITLFDVENFRFGMRVIRRLECVLAIPQAGEGFFGGGNDLFVNGAHNAKRLLRGR